MAISAADVKRAVLGINFGNSFASIAIVNKEGHADCIANEDGERQIACALAFNGQEEYIGNQATPQLVKNGKNTILGFRNALGKTPANAPKLSDSAPLKDVSGSLGYTVTVLPPSATTPAPSNPSSAKTTPAPTRPSSPPAQEPVEKTLSVEEVTSTFLKSLKGSAEDFLGREIDGTVISVPSGWDAAGLEALTKAASSAGLNLLQLSDESGLAVLGAVGQSPEGDETSRLSVVLDIGASSLTVSLLSVTITQRGPLIVPIGSETVPDVGGDAVDRILVTHFLKEFTKKTKVNVPFPGSSTEDKRAESKMRLALLHTKKALAASPAAAAVSVESLHSGLDLNNTINRIRFDSLLSNAIYSKITSSIASVLEKAKVPKETVSEVLLVGASASLNGLGDRIAAFFGDESNVKVRTDLDPSQLIAKGAALQAAQLYPLKDTPTDYQKAQNAVPVTIKPVGIAFAGASEEVIPPSLVIAFANTPLPFRKVVRLELPKSLKRVGVELWECDVVLKEIERQAIPQDDDEDEEDEDTAEPEKEALIKKSVQLAGAAIDLAGGKSTTVVELRIDLTESGEAHLSGKQVS